MFRSSSGCQRQRRLRRANSRARSNVLRFFSASCSRAIASARVDSSVRASATIRSTEKLGIPFGRPPALPLTPGGNGLPGPRRRLPVFAVSWLISATAHVLAQEFRTETHRVLFQQFFSFMLAVDRTPTATTARNSVRAAWRHYSPSNRLRLRIGCIRCHALQRFAESAVRNVCKLRITLALRNQQVAGSSPAAGSSSLNDF